MRYNFIKRFISILAGIVTAIIPVCVSAQNNLIYSVDCVSSRPEFEFDITEKWLSDPDVCPHTTALVGDIDGDGRTEILAISDDFSKIYVFEGETGASIGYIDFEDFYIQNENPTCFLLVDGDKDGQAEIFAAGTNSQMAYLFEVSSAPGTRPITFTKRWEVPFMMNAFCSGVTPVVADLDGDGVVEFVAGDQIISYDGKILATLPFSSILGFDISMSYVADVDGDGLPEIIAGSDVYKYANGVITLYARCPEFPSGKDGWNMSADMNLDGNIDLVFNSGEGIIVWTPKTNTVIDRINTIQTGYSSCPFIGDIDGIEVNGKKYPEFCINTDHILYAFSFDGTSYSIKWTLSHSDGSGVTMLTLFDFNLDGVVELVYRDETDLRIFDGSGSAPVVLFSIPCLSGTTTETPVVADVTGDGSADIIVTGYPSGGYNNGRVYVFEGGASKWASCPSVWNQQLYSPLWVNLDLTVPDTIQLQNLDFQQTCGNGIKATYYNGGPMQAPFISSTTHCPFDFSSDVFVVNGSRSIAGNSITITVTFGNQGMVNASGNIPIQFYKDAISSGNIIGSTTLGADVGGADLPPGATRTITRTFTVNPMSLLFYVRALDDGLNFPALGAFSDCDLTNNTKSFGTLELTKEIGRLYNCLSGKSVFTVKLKNDGATTYSNIELTDSLGLGWDFISATPGSGTSAGSYNPTTRTMLWTIPSLAPGDSAILIVKAQATVIGDLRNFSWVNSVNGLSVGREYKSAYVIVSDAPCLIAEDDFAQTIGGVPVTIDVLANDDLVDCPTLVPSIPSQPANGSASVSGNQIIFTSNTGFSGETQFDYEISCNGTTASATVYITVSPAPSIILQDSCSTRPKLQVNIQYAGATYEWYYSEDGNSWELITGANAATLFITKGGQYKAVISYNGMVITTAPIKLVIEKKILLPGHVWWYQIIKN